MVFAMGPNQAIQDIPSCAQEKLGHFQGTPATNDEGRGKEGNKERKRRRGKERTIPPEASGGPPRLLKGHEVPKDSASSAKASLSIEGEGGYQRTRTATERVPEGYWVVKKQGSLNQYWNPYQSTASTV